MLGQNISRSRTICKYWDRPFWFDVSQKNQGNKIKCCHVKRYSVICTCITVPAVHLELNKD